MACDIMLDLETMGNGADGAIVAIGACAFDMQAEVLEVLSDGITRVGRIATRPSMDSLRSGTEREADRQAFMDGLRPRP